MPVELEIVSPEKLLLSKSVDMAVLPASEGEIGVLPGHADFLTSLTIAVVSWKTKEGARQFPTLVPITPGHASVAENLAAWKVLEAFDKPFLTAFSDADPVTKGGEVAFQARVTGAKGQPHVMLKGSHFLQEDCPDDLVEVIDAAARRAR